MQTTFRHILLLAAISLSILSCSKDSEGDCNVSTDDYTGTYYGQYATSVGISGVADTLTITKGSSDTDLNIYSSRLGATITANTNCNKYTINSFKDVAFSVDYMGKAALVTKGEGTGSGQLNKSDNKLNVVINFSTVTVDFGTGAAEYKNTLNLSGDFTKQ